MPKTVIQRLRKIDLKVAQRVDRGRIGNLVGRLYFTPSEGDRAGKIQEVPITGFTDQGNGSNSGQTGISSKAHSFQVQVDRDWYDRWRGVEGQYSIRSTGLRRDDAVNVEITSETADDAQTFALMGFVYDFQISSF